MGDPGLRRWAAIISIVYFPPSAAVSRRRRARKVLAKTTGDQMELAKSALYLEAETTS